MTTNSEGSDVILDASAGITDGDRYLIEPSASSYSATTGDHDVETNEFDSKEIMYMYKESFVPSVGQLAVMGDTNKTPSDNDAASIVNNDSSVELSSLSSSSSLVSFLNNRSNDCFRFGAAEASNTSAL